VMPFTWCVDDSDGRGTQRWHWKQWEAPRPLYVPATLLSGEHRLPVVLVEGEKCALAGHQLLGHEFDFVSWPGGGKAWDKAHWGWLMGRTVYMWPDCDAKRERLSKAERDACVDPGTKPLLPEHKQPGVQAMVQIGAHLVAEHGCTVYLCPVPAPGAVADGWDIADAIAQGWGPDEVRAFVRGAREFVPPQAAASGGGGAAGGGGAGISTPSIAGAGSDDEADDWRCYLIKNDKGHARAVRDNVVLALDGLPSSGVAGLPEAAGVIAFNDFTNNVEKLGPSPWGTGAGEWDEVDELEMGNWLTRQHWLPSMSRATLEEAVAMVAKRHRYHPVRDALARLQGRWDGEKRLGTWVRICCLEEDEWDDKDPLQQYLARVGTWLVMAICARVLTPGCKFDYMTIFEGPQGWGKSTLAKLLGIDWFADTGLVLGDKDSYQNLQGVLVYEWGELDSLTRSEVTKVKQFISSAKDRFRASFDRRPRDYPRQVVFIGTTNEDHYLVDPTGNRRMWPVRVTRPIDLDWFRANRDQLYAEALSYLAAGERFHPTHKEQKALFEPQQQQRQIESAIQAACMRYLYDESQKVGVSGENGSLVNQISAPELLGRLGISVDKQTHVLLRQVTAALRQAGWVRFRSSRADRPWMFRRPEGKAGQDAGASGSSASTPPADAGNTQEVADECPF
jgi:putative DNA primase/helicase